MGEKKGPSRDVLRRAAKLGDAVTGPMRTVLKPTARLGFPYRKPTVPRGVEVPDEPSRLGADYDTDWARRPLAKAARTAIHRGPLQVAVKAIADPEVLGTDRLADLARLDDDAPPLIFAPNHYSHLDTLVMSVAVPEPWRGKLMVAAAADYFFDTPTKAALAAWAYGAVPMERRKVSRRSADRAAALLDAGWSVLIFPEGGRSPDGWGQEHKGGAAYLGVRCGVPIVPIHLDGTGRVLPKGSSRPEPARVTINLGTPLRAAEGEDARALAVRVESAIAELADETETDWWTARRRAHAAATPSLRGPEHDTWRRDWSSPDRRPGRSGPRRWPD